MKFRASTILFLNFALLFTLFLLIPSCKNATDKSISSPQDSVVSVTANGDLTAIKEPSFSSDNMEVRIFEVKDSIGKSLGWGYDIYVDNKKTIHQPMIPAIQGNRAFKTESDAKKTGLFALSKMIKEGTLPALLISELDSLGVLK